MDVRPQLPKDAWVVYLCPVDAASILPSISIVGKNGKVVKENPVNGSKFQIWGRLHILLSSF